MVGGYTVSLQIVMGAGKETSSGSDTGSEVEGQSRVLSFGEFVRIEAEKQHVLNCEIAENCGVSPSYVSKLYKGVIRQPGPTVLRGICRTLGFDMEKVIEEYLIDPGERNLNSEIGRLLDSGVIPQSIVQVCQKMCLTKEYKKSMLAFLTEMVKLQEASLPQDG